MPTPGKGTGAPKPTVPAPIKTINVNFVYKGGPVKTVTVKPGCCIKGGKR